MEMAKNARVKSSDRGVRERLIGERTGLGEIVFGIETDNAPLRSHVYTAIHAKRYPAYLGSRPVGFDQSKDDLCRVEYPIFRVVLQR